MAGEQDSEARRGVGASREGLSQAEAGVGQSESQGWGHRASHFPSRRQGRGYEVRPRPRRGVSPGLWRTLRGLGPASRSPGGPRTAPVQGHRPHPGPVGSSSPLGRKESQGFAVVPFSLHLTHRKRRTFAFTHGLAEHGQRVSQPSAHRALCGLGALSFSAGVRTHRRTGPAGSRGAPKGPLGPRPVCRHHVAGSDGTEVPGEHVLREAALG